MCESIEILAYTICDDPVDLYSYPSIVSGTEIDSVSGLLPQARLSVGCSKYRVARVKLDRHHLSNASTPSTACL